MELVRRPSLWTQFLENNGYILHDCVGAGSFGDVFAVTATSTGKRLALKRIVVRGKVADDKYVMSEIEALMVFDHSNIIALEEFMICKNLACIILELAPCGSLDLKMAENRGRLNEAFIRRSFQQLLSAVAYCHDHDFAHRDINPSNILIFNENLLKLADFGLCFCCKDQTTNQPIMCTDYLGQEAYLAPEVKIQEPFHAKPADVWSLGCVLFFMANGRNPPVDGYDYLKLLNDSQTVVLSRNNDVDNNNNNSKTNVIYLNIIKKVCSVKVEVRPELPEFISLCGC